MEIHGIDLWQKTAQQASSAYKEYFDAEINFLKKYLFSQAVVLDLGCGNGRMITSIAPLVQKVVGIDNDARAIELAENNTKEYFNVSLLLQDATQMKFQDNEFDVVFCGMTFVNFAENKYVILSEIKRVLKHNGMFIFSVFNEHALPYRQEMYNEYPGGFTIVDSEKGTVRFNDVGVISEQFSEKEITEILNAASFEIEKIKTGKIYYLISAVKSNYKVK